MGARCNTAFDIVDAVIMRKPTSMDVTASTKELRKALNLSADVKLDITHYLNFVLRGSG